MLARREDLIKKVSPLLTVLLLLTGASEVHARTSQVSVSVKVTGYNSLAAQTDSTPFITATGTRTRVGVIALSPDLRRTFPYGTKVRISGFIKTNGCNPAYLPKPNQGYYIVEDSTSSRKTRTADVWFPTRSAAINFGKCYAILTKA